MDGSWDWDRYYGWEWAGDEDDLAYHMDHVIVILLCFASQLSSGKGK